MHATNSAPEHGVDGADSGIRDRSGRFVKGNPGSPGRKPRTTELQYLARLGDRVTIERWEAVVDMALKQASNGDGAARDWLSRFILPNPDRITLRAARESEIQTELSGVSGTARTVATRAIPTPPGDPLSLDWETPASVEVARQQLAEALTADGLSD